MRDPAARAGTGVIDRGRAITAELRTGLRPTPGFERPMILTTMRWFSVARLAHSLVAAGFSVSVCRPGGQALGLVEGLVNDAHLSRFRPLSSLLLGIRDANPDIILPGDEHALVLLRRVHSLIRGSDPRLADLISRSIGRLEYWSFIISRTAMANKTRRLGVLTPETRVIGDPAALDVWVSEQGLPVVLKTDGSCGGRGVAIIRQESDLVRAWRTLSAAPGLTRALKRSVFDADDSVSDMFLRRTRSAVNAQEFVTGREATASVACLNGRVLGSICLEVVQTSKPKGPASVVKRIDNHDMERAVAIIVGQFGLSGFCGFDFLITNLEKLYLVEVNFRATPTCHFLVEGTTLRSEPIILFPPDLDSSLSGETLNWARVDRPLDAPSLVRAGERAVARKDRRSSRIVARLGKRLTATGY